MGVLETQYMENSDYQKGRARIFCNATAGTTHTGIKKQPNLWEENMR